jgi:hypothetical protein
MGNKGNPLDRLAWLTGEDSIDKISMALFTMLIGVILLGVILPIFVSQIAGWSSNPLLGGWVNLSALQTLLYALPLVFGIGMMIFVVRFFSRSRE